MNTHRTMSPAREKKILLAIGRKKHRNIDKWAKRFVEMAHRVNNNEEGK